MTCLIEQNMSEIKRKTMRCLSMMCDTDLELFKVMGRWFKNSLKHQLRVPKNEAYDLYQKFINNIEGGAFFPCRPQDKITSQQEWHDLLNRLGPDEIMRHNHFCLVKHYIPEIYEEGLREFLNTISYAIRETLSNATDRANTKWDMSIYQDPHEMSWSIDDCNCDDGYSLLDWAQYHKPELKKNFERLWKQEYRKNHHPREISLEQAGIS